MNESIELLKIVALLDNAPDKSLRRGQVGTVVEQLDDDVWEVEFCDPQGRTYAMCACAAIS